MKVPQESWLNPKVKVSRSPIDRLGLFPAATIIEGEKVMMLGGSIVTDKQLEEKMKSKERYDAVGLDLDANLSVLPKDWPGIHGNHSCDPNLWMADAVTVIARRHIGVGEELVVDYALFTISPNWSMKCSCGSDLCRKQITGNDWKLPELQQRYRGHFSPFIEKLIVNRTGSISGRPSNRRS